MENECYRAIIRIHVLWINKKNSDVNRFKPILLEILSGQPLTFDRVELSFQFLETFIGYNLPIIANHTITSINLYQIYNILRLPYSIY